MMKNVNTVKSVKLSFNSRPSVATRLLTLTPSCCCVCSLNSFTVSSLQICNCTLSPLSRATWREMPPSLSMQTDSQSGHRIITISDYLTECRTWRSLGHCTRMQKNARLGRIAPQALFLRASARVLDLRCVFLAHACWRFWWTKKCV